MSWEAIVKKKPLVGGQKKLDKDKDGDIDGDDFAEMRKEAECRISICEATDCKYNEMRKCTLPEVNLSRAATCMSYSKKYSRRGGSPETVTGRISPSLIDRATRNLNEEKRMRR